MNAVSRIGLVTLAFIACAGFADDPVWIQQKSVAIGNANFQQCVTTALAGVKGVSVNSAATASANKVVLAVDIAKTIPFLDAEVQHRGGNTATVVFFGRGAEERNDYRNLVTPVMLSIVDAINRTCGSAKPKS